MTDAREEAARINQWAEDRFPADESAFGVDEDSFVAGAEWQASRQPATDDEREALDYAIRVPLSEARLDYRPLWKLIRAVQDSVLAAGFRRSQSSPDWTDAQVEAAQDAFHAFVFGDEEPLTKREKGITRQAWRVALEAASSARTTENKCTCAVSPNTGKRFFDDQCPVHSPAPSTSEAGKVTMPLDPEEAAKIQFWMTEDFSIEGEPDEEL